MIKDSEIIPGIMADAPGAKVIDLVPITGKGFVNRVFLIETAAAKYIARLNSADALDEYKKEVWATDRAIEKRIPAPKILKVGIFGNRAYSIQEYISGIEGRELPGDKKFIWKKLGEYAGRIHTVEVGGFGLDFGDMTGNDSESKWFRYLNYNIESLKREDDELLKLNVISKPQSKRICDIFEDLKSRNFRFGLNHGDLSLKNTIIDESGIVHLIDWGSSEASIVPHHDLIQLLKVNMQENDPDDSEIEAFLAGCGIDESEYRKMRPDLNVLLLLRAFDKLRWAIDWKIRDLKDYVLHAADAVKRLDRGMTPGL